MLTTNFDNVMLTFDLLWATGIFSVLAGTAGMAKRGLQASSPFAGTAGTAKRGLQAPRVPHDTSAGTANTAKYGCRHACPFRVLKF